MSKKTLSTPKAESQRMTNYRCIIPFYILYDLELNANHLRLYGQIEQLESNPNPKATASFSCKWLSEVLGINQRNANKIAEKLVEKGYIEHLFISGFGWIWRTKKTLIIDDGALNPDLNNHTPLSLRDTPPVAERHRSTVAERHPNILEANIPEVINKTLAQESQKNESPSPYPETYYPLNSEQNESDETFEAFWEMYPKKKSKLRAQAAWHSQKCSKRVHEILAKLDEQVKKDRQFIEGYAPNPDKYIHQELWNDEITPLNPRRSANIAPNSTENWADNLHLDLI